MTSSTFIAALSAKLAPNMSPRMARRLSEDSQGSGSSTPMNRGYGRGPGQSFLDSLNAKLAQQQQMCPSAGGNSQFKANRIRQIINSKAQVNIHL